MSNATLLYGHLADKELVKKVKGGQKAAFEVLVRRHSRALYRVVRMYEFSHSEAEELVICTHLQAYSPRNRYLTDYSYRTWLTRLSIENCIKAERQLPALRSGKEPACNAARSAHHYNSERLNLTSELTTHLEQCIEQLPLEMRGVFVLREIDGYSTEETAFLLNIAESQVMKELPRAKTEVKQRLGKLRHLTDIYPFDTDSCERVVHYVMHKINSTSDTPIGVPAF